MQKDDLFARIGQIAAKMVWAGPKVTTYRAKSAVQMLRNSVADASQTVSELTGIETAVTEALNLDLAIISREQWTKWMAEALQSSFAKATTQMPQNVSLKLPLREQVALSFILSRVAHSVLGGVDLHLNQMVIVAPNVVTLEQKFDVDVVDLRYWVAMREIIRATLKCHGKWMDMYVDGRLFVALERLLETETENEPKSIKTEAQGKLAHYFSRIVDGAKTAGSFIQEEIGTFIGYFAVGIGPGPRFIQLKPHTSAPLQNARSETRAQLLAKLLGAEVASVDDAQVTAVHEILFIIGSVDYYIDLVMEKVSVTEIYSSEILQRLARELHLRRAKHYELLARSLVGVPFDTYQKGADFIATVVSCYGLQAATKIWNKVDNIPTRFELSNVGKWYERVK